jgi:hypothetical protein
MSEFDVDVFNVFEEAQEPGLSKKNKLDTNPVVVEEEVEESEE